MCVCVYVTHLSSTLIQQNNQALKSGRKWYTGADLRIFRGSGQGRNSSGGGGGGQGPWELSCSHNKKKTRGGGEIPYPPRSGTDTMTPSPRSNIIARPCNFLKVCKKSRCSSTLELSCFHFKAMQYFTSKHLNTKWLRFYSDQCLVEIQFWKIGFNKTLNIICLETPGWRI